MANYYAIGVDVGGTNLRAGVVDEAGRVVLRSRASTGERRSAGEVVDRIAALVGELSDKFDSKILAVGCGVPGIVDADAGVVHRSPNFPEWTEVPVRGEISARLALPIVIDNDANMHALGEALCGAGRGHRSMIMLTLGSGIGGGIFLDGRIFRGDDGFAGEVGHIVVEPEGLPCGCGGRGCWELYAASRAFKVLAERLSAEERRALLSSSGVGIEALSPEIMAELAAKGEPIALAMWESYGRALGLGIASLLNALGVETFVIGGGISNSYELFVDAARRSALEHTYAWHSKHLNLKRAALGDDGGITGAALSALASLKNP